MKKYLLILISLILLLGFTPPVAEYSDDANTKTLLHMNGTDASTTFTDSEATPKTWTARGDAQLDTAQQKFGTASGLFDGTGDWVDTPDHADFNYGSAEFTVDKQIRINSLAAQMGVWGQGTDGNNYAVMLVNTNGSLRFFVLSAGSFLVDFSSAASTVTTNTWYHLAVHRSGNNWNIELDGNSVANTTANITYPDYTGVFAVGISHFGTGTQLPFNGWIDEYRVSNIDRYPPAAAGPTMQAIFIY